jgi:hypothetical protein
MIEIKMQLIHIQAVYGAAPCYRPSFQLLIENIECRAQSCARVLDSLIRLQLRELISLPKLLAAAGAALLQLNYNSKLNSSVLWNPLA